MAPHSSTLAWKIPWMEEPGRLPSMGSHRVGHDWSNLAAPAAAVSWSRWWRDSGRPLRKKGRLEPASFLRDGWGRQNLLRNQEGMPVCSVRSVVSNSLQPPWAAAYQVPLVMEISMQEYWSGLPFPPPEDLPDPGIETMSLESPTLADKSLSTKPSGKLWVKE